MSQDTKQRFTVFIVPHDEEATLSFRISFRIIAMVGIFLLLMIMGSAYLAFEVVDLKEEAEKHQHLLRATRMQRENINQITSYSESLLDQVADFEEFRMEVAEKIEKEEPEEGDLDELLTTLATEEAENSSEERLVREVSRGDSGGTIEDRTEENIQTLNRLLPVTEEAIAELKGDVEEYEERMAATPDIWPTEGRITSGFGTRRDPFTRATNFHSGVDIANDRGTKIYATADGTVANASYQGGYGRVIEIDHGYGYLTLYAHLNSKKVSEGEEVEKGEVIGRMGSTGRSTGPHLHYEVHVNGSPVDPKDYME